jgi:hypothetical protein
MSQPPIIRVPKTARSSYQPHRPLWKNTLLQNQVRHFLEVEKDLPPEHRTDIVYDSIKTEADAAEYIRRVTEKLHSLGAKT